MIFNNPEIKKVFCTSNKFFTTWSWILWSICCILKYKFNVNVPNFLMVASQNFILACCIVGYYIMYVYGHNIKKKFKSIKMYLIDIVNILTHVVPFIFLIIFNKFESINNLNQLIYSIIFSILFCTVYLITNNPKQVYWFTKWNLKKILKIGTIVYSSLYFIK